MSSDGDAVEQRSVSVEEVKAGVKLNAGHAVVLIVGGMRGTKPSGGGGTSESGEPDGGEPGGGEPAADEPHDAKTPADDGPDGPSDGKDPVEPERPPNAEPTPEKGTLEIEVLDFSGQPANAVLCAITLPDGTKREVRTDRQGMVRLGALPRDGSCQVSFPELKAPGGA